ncbi:TlpA disulfide reductase family protein [Sphingobacterium sp. UT-1RO-CII-1]|uniref:TlpA family protein disulfide reductase n=1 Tax=Sphingobacterium sp. UT-1RO-CII-1 TaxID=2995225 RepID=UPI00227BB3D9|nr:TlpA disulfide reductase family protein [Sphingobacterium sp. UT-1RO-CII-1]MCY4780997.1 TlpA disulfide reductase family protein [Sphingobacterium sp. UT-1RO-CII-1]
MLISFILIFVNINAQDWKVELGDTVPQFIVESKEGEKVNSDNFQGKVVLLNFFATWCPPCRQELPRLQKEIWDKWGKRVDFDVLVLAREEGWEKLDPFAEKFKYTFPFYSDLNRSVFSLFADSGIPRNVLVGKDGQIAYLSLGYTDDEFTELIALIGKLLDE